MVSFALAIVIGATAYRFSSSLLTKGAEMIHYVESKPAMVQVVAALATLILAFVVVWDRWTDKPKLEINTEDRTKISDEGKYSIKVPLLNVGRRDAYNCSVLVQVYNRKSGKKVDERTITQPQLKPGEKQSASIDGLLSFNGDFVAKISAETHKSKTDKIIAYNIENNSEVIIFKYGLLSSLKFEVEKFLLRKYRDEWDVDILSNGLKFERFCDPPVRKEIIKRLKEVGVKAVKPLIDRLEKEPSANVRNEIVKVLGDIGDKGAVEPLLKVLQEDRDIDAGDAGWCGWAIAKIGDKKSIKPLIQILKDGNQKERRKAAADALGIIGAKIKDESSEEALIEALEDSDKGVRCTIAKALGKVGTEKALKALEQNGRIKEEREEYKKAIEQIRFRMGCQ